MRGIPEDEELDITMSNKERQVVSGTSASSAKKQETLMTKSQQMKRLLSSEESTAPAPRKFRNAPKLVSANSAIMKKFAYEIGDSVGSRFDTIVRSDVSKDLKYLDKYETENKAKLRDNVDEAEEERRL